MFSMQSVLRLYNEDKWEKSVMSDESEVECCESEIGVGGWQFLVALLDAATQQQLVKK
jgi:hypothetical protein